MQRQVHVILAFVASTLLSVALGAQGTRTPATADFRDDIVSSPSDKIRSDGDPYPRDGADCVVCYTQKGGFFFLRTVKFECSTFPDPARFITLDFSDPVDPNSPCEVKDPNSGKFLNRCGRNDVPDVRLIANELFKDTALTNGTRVSLPFSLVEGGDFQATAFELVYEKNLDVEGSGTIRILTAPAGSVAELYQLKQGRKSTQRVSLGRFKMPFQVTVQQQ